jgi:hypothetical protein
MMETTAKLMPSRTANEKQRMSMFSNGNGIIDRCAPAKVLLQTPQERVVDQLRNAISSKRSELFQIYY